MNKPLVIAAAQLNLWVGDLDGNVARIVAAAVKARDELGAELVATPELSLIGYPPDDLLLRTALPAAIEAALAKVAAASRGIHIVVGHPEWTGGVVHNAASVYRDGQLVARARKQRLPNYGVFDERRHFEPGPAQATVFEVAGRRLALCICEDIWGPEPAAQAKAAGADLIVNVNASPYHVGKPAERLAVLCARVAETGLPIVYVNSTGGQDDLVFDGDSTAVAADGALSFRAPMFEDGVFPITVDAGHRPTGAIRAAAPVEAEVYAALVQATRDYVTRNGFPGALLGLSGGIDSALIAAIAADALGPEKVWAVSLPSRYTLDMSNDDARTEAEALGIRYSVLPIELPFAAFTDTLAPLFGDRPIDLAEENMQSRSRGVLLMALSNKFGPVVLTTGNKSEMAVGYATLYGDMCGGFAPIKDVYKTLVYRLAEYRNTLAPAGRPVIPVRVIERPPTAELRPDQKDSDSLPPYEVLDPILEAYVEQCLSIPEIVALGFEEATVRRVAGLVRRSEYKRRQAPPGPKVTPRAFGRERRYPLTAVYGDL
jgi:NAD+ synthase (glutamine-hydrolysing)